MLPIPQHGMFAIVAQHPETTNAKGEVKRHTAHAWLTADDASEQSPTFFRAMAWAQACNATGSDIFYTTGGFEGELEEYTGRKAANVVAQRSLFLDVDMAKWGLDVGTTGIDAVLGWLEATPNLEVPSLVVNSGGGMHIYWICDSDIPLDRWHAAADRLRNGAKLAFFDAVDVQCTIDRARILRLPGFVNHKYPADVEILWPYGEHAQPIYTIEQLEVMVADWPRTAAALSTAANLGALAALGLGGMAMPKVAGSAFGAAQVSEPASWSRMEKAARDGEGCMVLADAMTNSATLPYDTWCGMLTVLACTDNFEAGAHAISRDHPDWGDTQNVDTAHAKASSFGGPRRCASFNSSLCGGCHHQGKITSPVEIGRHHVRLDKATVAVAIKTSPDPFSPDVASVEEVVHVLPDPPANYRYDHNGVPGTYFVDRTSNEDGSWETTILKIWSSPIWVLRRASGTGATVGKLGCFHPDGRLIEIEYAGWTADLASQLKCIKALVDRGIRMEYPLTKAGTEVHTSFMRAVTAMQNNTSEVVRQYGPLDKRDQSGFSIGNIRYNVDGTTRPIKLDPTFPASRVVEDGMLPSLPDGITVAQAIVEWNQHLRRVHGIRQGLDDPLRALDRLMVASGFGAVLPLFTENESHRGGFISLMSNTAGSGKTSMLQTALSLYAQRTDALMVTGTTENGWRGQSWAACALPVVLDDFWQNDRKGDNAERVKLMLLGSTSRSARASLTSANEQFTSTWAYMTGNKDVVSEIAANDAAAGGALRRMLNIHVPDRHISPVEADQFDEFVDWQRANGGILGHVWISYVVTHLAEVRAARNHWRDQLVAESEPMQSHQYEFVRAIMANTLAAADVAGKQGLHPYSMSDLFATAVHYIQQSWDAMHGAIVADSDLLSNLLTRAGPHTLIANANGNKNFTLDRLPTQTVYVRRYPDTGEIAISSAGLRSLCAMAKVQPARVVADMGNYGVRRAHIDLAGGTVLAGLHLDCYVFKIPTSTAPITTNTREAKS